MSLVKFNNLDSAKAFQELRDNNEIIDLKKVLTKERVLKYSIQTAGGLTFNYAARQINEKLIDILQRLADEQQVIDKYKNLLSGDIMNPGENRMVLHHLTRGEFGNQVKYEGKDLREFYNEQQNRLTEFAGRVHSQRIKGSTGKPFDTVVQIGIGGSDLGPRAMYLALLNYVIGSGKNPMMRGKFISNIDPDDANGLLSQVDFETTLFILVSKSGTTQETLTNRKFVIEKAKALGIPGLVPEKHMVAVTSQTSPLAESKDYLDSFYIDNFIGGRFSSTSAVGGVILSLTFGSDIFKSFLQGAAENDKACLIKDIRKNAALMDALIGIYERNILKYPVSAVLPYSQALSRFPAHLQQLDMESNGKCVNRIGEPVSYPTGPVIFGEPGTNGQHSFYQLLHQGTDICPLQFIGFEESQDPFDIDMDGSLSQQKLNANLSAQITAFALGKEDSNSNKNFTGNRPSSLIHGKKLTPEALGALLAFYENKVMFQGLIWNLNSFDQEGVQLGKVLTNQVLKGENLEPVLESYAKLLKVK